MNGPAHYRAAEALLLGVVDANGLVWEQNTPAIAAAQAHATLALAAAVLSVAGSEDRT